MHARHLLLYLVPVFLVLGIILGGSTIQELIFDSTSSTTSNEDEVVNIDNTENGLEEGTASPSGLTGAWVWTERRGQDGTSMQVPNIELFSLTFADGVFETTTDCNMVAGAYEVGTEEIVFKDISMTRMYCEGSSEQLFVDTLSAARSYELLGRRLVLTLEGEEGTAVFSKR